MTESILSLQPLVRKYLASARRGLALFFIAFAVGVSDGATPPPAQPIPLPGYLSGYEALYAISPRQAARKWFLEAKYGLMVHYCLASLLNKARADTFPLSGDRRTCSRPLNRPCIDAAPIFSSAGSQAGEAV